MEKLHLDILTRIGNGEPPKWLDDSRTKFSITGMNAKFVEGIIASNEKNHFSFEITKTNYNQEYLKKKLKNLAADNQMEALHASSNISFALPLELGQSIWTYSDGFTTLGVGTNSLLPKGTRYYKIDGGALSCNPIGALRQDTNVTFMGMQNAKCNSAAVTVSYAIFQI